MIRRACWMGSVGAFSMLLLYVLPHMGIPVQIVATLRIILPAFLIWYLFRPPLINRAWIRFFALASAIIFAFFASLLSLPDTLRDILADVRLGISVSEVAAFILLAFLVPLSLGTPSKIRSTMRLGIVALALIPIPFALHALMDLLVKLGERRLDGFGFLFGLPAVEWGLFIAALAPDHIAMERAALARNSLPNCEKCEYDLTGNVSGVCPECGTPLSETLQQRVKARP